MFSFLGRGICKLSTIYLLKPILIHLVYVFVGSVIVGPRWFRFIPGTVVGIFGIAYAVLEYIPSIEPPANMRYVATPQTYDVSY
jgi:hypothetical protein